MAELMTPFTRQILTELFQKRSQKAVDENVAKGQIMQEGDGFHSEAGQRAEEIAHFSNLRAKTIEDLLQKTGDITIPTQNASAELGHQIKTLLLDDESISEYAARHSLPPDKLVTTSSFTFNYRSAVPSE